MSGKVTLSTFTSLLVRNLSRGLTAKLRIAYSGGCDYFNIDKVVW